MYDQFLFGGGGRDGGSSERCFSGVVGVIKGSFQKHLKQGVGESKSCSKGEGVLKVTTQTYSDKVSRAFKHLHSIAYYKTSLLKSPKF